MRYRSARLRERPIRDAVEAMLSTTEVDLLAIYDDDRGKRSPTRLADERLHDRTLVLSRMRVNGLVHRNEKTADLSAVFCSGGRTRTSDQAVTQTPRFPSGADYLFAIAL